MIAKSPRRSVLPRIAAGALLRALSYAAPFLLLRSADAAAQPCGSNCGKYYRGQISSTLGYQGISGFFGFPGTTLADPTNDGLLHWLGLTRGSRPVDGGTDWMQVGAWNGFGNGGSGSSTYNWYVEFNSWCNGYSVGTYGSTAASISRFGEVYYTGNSYNCGWAPYVFYEVVGRIGSTGTYVYAWINGQFSRADANTEIKAGAYFEPLGGYVCYGADLSGANCGSSSGLRLRLSNGFSWSDWTAAVVNPGPTGPGYSKTTLNANYRFHLTGVY